MLTEIENALERLFPARTECDSCSRDIGDTEVVVLEGLLWCPSCAMERAAMTLSPLMLSAWTPADVESGRVEYEEAAKALRALLARAEARMAGRY